MALVIGKIPDFGHFFMLTKSAHWQEVGWGVCGIRGPREDGSRQQ